MQRQQRHAGIIDSNYAIDEYFMGPKVGGGGAGWFAAPASCVNRKLIKVCGAAAAACLLIKS